MTDRSPGPQMSWDAWRAVDLHTSSASRVPVGGRVRRPVTRSTNNLNDGIYGGARLVIERMEIR